MRQRINRHMIRAECDFSEKLWAEKLFAPLDPDVKFPFRMENGVHKLDPEESKEGGLYAYADIGRCEFACEYCGALKWKDENQPKWCCGEGS